jgi:hypothetical protein
VAGADITVYLHRWPAYPTAPWGRASVLPSTCQKHTIADAISPIIATPFKLAVTGVTNHVQSTIQGTRGDSVPNHCCWRREPLASKEWKRPVHRFTFQKTTWGKFPDGTDNIEIGGFLSKMLVSGEHVLFLASYNNDVTWASFKSHRLLQSFIESLTVVLPYSPVGKSMICRVLSITTAEAHLSYFVEYVWW